MYGFNFNLIVLIKNLNYDIWINQIFDVRWYKIEGF